MLHVGDLVLVFNVKQLIIAILSFLIRGINYMHAKPQNKYPQLSKNHNYLWLQISYGLLLTTEVILCSLFACDTKLTKFI